MTGFFKTHQYYLLSQAASLLIVLCFSGLPQAGLNDGDSITHYYISRYSWQYPHLFLDNWGKPFFILLSSPFSQFGYSGIQVFNIICAVFSGWFCYRIAAKLEIKWAFLAPVFLFFTPVYIRVIPSGLTEVLFGMVFIISIFLAVEKKYIAAAIVASFLPFCRMEGILIIPIFGFFFLVKKEYKIIPFLLTGFLVYACIGYFYNGDFLWAVHTNPYKGTDVYGHGKLSYFFKSRSAIFGDIPGTLFALGTVFLAFTMCARLKKIGIQTLQGIEALLICGSVIIFFAAHSVFWYKGWFGSAGMWRVFAAVAPAFAIESLRGFVVGVSLFKRVKWFYLLAAGVLVTVIILTPVLKLPQKLDERKTTVKIACDWVKQQNLQGRKIYYSEPFTELCLSLNPYDNQQSKELMYVDRTNPGSEMTASNIVIWESGLGPREDGIPVEKLLANPKFHLLKKFEAPNEMAGDQKYAVYVFERK